MDDGIDLKEYLALIAKYWILIVSSILVAVTFAALYTWLSEPVYESDVRLLVVERGLGDGSLADAFQGILISERLTKTYTAFVNRESFLEGAAEEAGIPESGKDLMGRIDASTIKGTQILEVSARGSSPESAATLANAVGEWLVSEADQLYRQAEATDSTSLVELSIIDVARPSSAPTSPIPALNLMMGLLAGALLGMFAAFAREHLDTRIKDGADLQRVLGSVPVIAGIPKVDDARVDRLVVRENSQSPASESYRALRTSLGYLNFDGSTRIIVFSSATPREGKTTITANTGAALAHAGKKVLVVGADMRRPRLHEAMSVKTDVGLSSVLISAVAVDDAIQPTNTEGLFALPAGPIPPNPAELLGSQRMTDLVKELAEEFDYVLLDAPPLLPVTDTMVLGQIADALVLVSRVGVTKRESLEKTVVRLNQLRSKLVGAVLNGARIDARYEYSYTSKVKEGISIGAPQVAVIALGVLIVGYVVLNAVR